VKRVEEVLPSTLYVLYIYIYIYTGQRERSEPAHAYTYTSPDLTVLLERGSAVLSAASGGEGGRRSRRWEDGVGEGQEEGGRGRGREREREEESARTSISPKGGILDLH
jgi:hypothetical protein